MGTDHWKFRRAARAAVLAATRANSLPPNSRSEPHDILLVPCWRRPEMLWHCIDNICKAEGLETVHVVFRPDSGSRSG